MDLLHFRLLVLISFLVAGQTSAEPGGQMSGAAKAERNMLQELYGGVVVNQTITVAGQDFYQNFATAWREKDLSERYSISIHERPSARSGTQVWVEFAQRRIFQAALPTGRAGIKALSEQAVEIAQQKVADIEVERLLFRDADLGTDEI